ncbi:MAG: hypothetical protein V4580_06545 [Bacteroidota bacterium]
MKQNKLLTWLLLLATFSLRSNAANYTEYYQLINMAEETFVLKKDKSCFVFYDKAFKKHKPFLKDPFIASQIALYLGDTLKFYDYLKIGFQNGLPLTAINVSPLIKQVNTNHFQKRIQAMFEKEYKPKRIDQHIMDKICLMCYQSDSIKVNMGGRNDNFYKNENDTRSYILDSFLIRGKFPNEQLLGVTTNQMYLDFYKKFNRKDVYAGFSGMTNDMPPDEFELRLKCPYNIILHSRCFYSEHKQLFYQAMLNGYIHPKEIGILEETAIIWHNDAETNPAETCQKPAYKICYNIFGKDPRHAPQLFDSSEQGLKQVEENRKNIYMQKYSVDQQKKLLEKNTGIKFFFDFLDR